MMTGPTFGSVRTLLAGAGLAVALAGGACGGESPPPPKVAAKPPPPPAPVPRKKTTVSPGQKVGVSVGGADSELTGDARASYEQGFQAWLSGDLDAAKAAFSEAARKAPTAGGPRYSLG